MYHRISFFDSADVCIDFAVTKVAALFVSGGYHTWIHRYDLYIVADNHSTPERDKKVEKSDDLKYSTVEYYYLFTLASQISDLATQLAWTPDTEAKYEPDPKTFSEDLLKSDPGEEKRKEGGKRKKEKKGARREKEKKKREEEGRGRNYD